MKLVNRIFFSFMWIIVLSVLMSAFIGSILISKTVWSDAITRVRVGLKEAHSYLDERLAELSISTEILANRMENKIKLPIKPDFIIEGREEVSVFLKKLQLDSPILNLSTVDLPINNNFKIEGYILIPLKLLKNTKKSIPLCPDGKVLCLFSLVSREIPVFSGIILNGNIELIEHLQKSLFYEGYYGNKPFGTVTIFCKDTRINTTVVGPDGRIAVGTRVSDVVKKRVLDEGKMWLDRAYVVDDWYISAYEPIKNINDDNIGILYVGVLEKRYVDIRKTTILSLSAIVIPSLGLLIFVVFLLSKSISKPLTQLSEASNKIAHGEFIPVRGNWGKVSEINVLANMFNRMVNAIKDREKKLKEQNLQLEETNRAYQELLSFVTHELNNSIGSLLLNISILADGTMGEMDMEQREVVELILRDVERFKDMVRNYLNISRLEKGTLKYNPSELDLRFQVVEPVLKRYEKRIKHRGLKVSWDWDEGITIFGDQELMDICYSNLIVNAIKYGRDWLELKAKRERKEGREFVLLGVINGGDPIPEDKIDLLFKKFSRLVKSDDGAGLGLYLVKKIVERHGGTVWCDTSRGTGFFIRLPST